MLMSTKKKMITASAHAAHEVNRAYCLAVGDTSQPPWDNAAPWQRDSAIDGARKVIEDPDTTPEESHQAWLDYKRAEGWKYGAVKDPETKEHPCMVPYADLPEEQRVKDKLFLATVKNMAHALKAKVDVDNEL